MGKGVLKGNKVTGSKGKDTIKWQNKSNWNKNLTVDAGAGNDLIDFTKSAKVNTFIGGKGNDTIKTGTGKSSTIIINKGDGNDTIYTKGKPTLVKIGSASTKDKMAFSKTGKDLKLTYTYVKTSKDKKQVKQTITFKNYFNKDGSVYKDNITLQTKSKSKIVALLKSKGLTMTAKYETTFVGTPFKDTITGTYGNDTIKGNANNDRIDVKGGMKNSVYGGDGHDTIFGAGGNDSIYGGNGNDSIAPGGGTNTIDAGAGKDTINISDGTNNIKVGADNDKIFIKGGVNTIDAGAGNDEIHFDSSSCFTSFQNTIKQGSGNDTIFFDDQKDFTNVASEYDGNNLIVYGGNSNRIVLENFVNGHSVKYVSVNGVQKSINEILVQFVGTDDADVIKATDGDVLIGGKGSDTYEFEWQENDWENRKHTTIIMGDDGEADTIKFNGFINTNYGINNGDFLLIRDNDDLTIWYNKTPSDDSLDFVNYNTSTDGIIGEYNGEKVGRQARNMYYSSIRIKEYFTAENPTIDKILLQKFGETFEDSIRSRFTNNMGSFTNEEVTGTKYGDYIGAYSATVYAGEGNDSIHAQNHYSQYGENKTNIYGGAGNDEIRLVNNSGWSNRLDSSFISGGADNDTMHICGSEKTDNITFEFSEGDGQDIIENDNDAINGHLIFNFTNVAMENIHVSQDNDDYVVSYGSGTDKITIKNGFKFKENITINSSDLQTTTVLKELGIVVGSGEIEGTDGAETIYGDTIADVITPKKGKDTIYGSAGNDTIVFNNGDGNDEVHQGSNGDTDSLKFADSELSDLDFSRGITNEVENDDLIISYNGGADSVTVKDYFATGNTITKWIDKNGVEHDLATENRHAINTLDETVNGTVFNDIITLNGTNCSIIGGDGANTYLVPSSGIYYITSTSGKDTIEFLGLGFDKLTFLIEENHAKIRDNYWNVTVYIQDYLSNMPTIYVKDNNGETTTLISKLADSGFIYSDAELIEGNAGVADRIFGGDSANTIDGKGGADTINGGKGNDIIQFAKGYGTATVVNGTETDEVDTLQFTDSTLDDLDYEVSEKDLIVKYNNANDSVTVKDYFTSSNTFKNLITTDGTYSMSDIKHVIHGETTITGTDLNDRIYGTNGDDTITASLGNDEFIDSEGADTYEIDWQENDWENRKHTTIIMSEDSSNDTIKINGFDSSSGLGNGNTLLIRDNDDLTIWYNSFYDNSLPYEGGEHGIIGEYNGEVVGRWARYVYASSIRIKDYFNEETYPNPIDKFIFQKYVTVEDSILAHYVNDMGSFNNEENPVVGTKYCDEIAATDCTVLAGEGKDTIFAYNYIKPGQENAYKNKTKIYGEAGDDEIRLTNTSGYQARLDTVFISGGTGNDEIHLHGGYKTDKITLEFSVEDGQDTITNGNDLITGDILLKFTDVAAKDVAFSTKKDGGNTQGIFSYGDGDDKITVNRYETRKQNNFTAVDASDNRNYFRRVNPVDGYQEINMVDIVETNGNDDVVTVVDAASTGIHVVFDIAQNGTNIIADSMRILDDANLAKWQENMADESIKGINIKGSDISAIETIRANDGKYLGVTQLEALKSDVAGWLSTGGRDYASVGALTSEDREALITFIAENTNWQ
ncbi:hypothetical protein IKP85_03260 [bacterium]|nr:hypothetical protein [bacterium]